MRPTFMTIVFNLQAAKSSTAFSCLFGKMRKYIFYRKKCGWQYHFSCCDGCKRIDFQFLCLPKRKICAQSKKKKKKQNWYFSGCWEIAMHLLWMNKSGKYLSSLEGEPMWAKFNLEDWGGPQKLFILFTELYANIHATFTYIFAYEFVVGAKSLGKFPWDPTNYIYFPLKEGKIF